MDNQYNLQNINQDKKLADCINQLKSDGFSLEIEAKKTNKSIECYIIDANEHYCERVKIKKNDLIGANIKDIDDEFKNLYYQLIYYLIEHNAGDFFNLYIKKDQENFEIIDIDKSYIYDTQNEFYEIMACVLHKSTTSLRIFFVVRNFDKEIEIINRIGKILEINSYNDKITNISEVVSNLTHSWRQPLNSLNFSIINFKDEIIDATGDAKLANEYYNEIWSILESLSNKIEKFRSFFERNYEEKYYDLIQYLDLIFEILDEKIKKENIQIHIDAKDVFEVYGSPNEFVQIMYCIFFDIIEHCKAHLDIFNRKLNIEIYKDEKNAVISIQIIFDRKKCTDFALDLEHMHAFAHIIHEILQGSIDLINDEMENKVVISFPL